jgi:hypothetical protein
VERRAPEGGEGEEEEQNLGMIRAGLQIPNFLPGRRADQLFERVADIAVAAEDAGFDTVMVMTTLPAAPRPPDRCSSHTPPATGETKQSSARWSWRHTNRDSGEDRHAADVI